MSANQSQLLDILECPVCLDTCTPPIYQCQNGHVICNGCYGKVTNCAICRVNLTSAGIRCLVLEKMAEDVELPCKFEGQGCETKLKISSMVSHGMDCPYGSSAVCQYLQGITCHALVSNNPNAITTHLTESHGAVIVPTTDTGIIRLTKWNLDTSTTVAVRQHPPMCLAYDGRIFILIVTKTIDDVSLQVFLAGSSNAARGYRVRFIAFGNFGSADECALHVIWAGPVHGADIRQPESKPHFKIYKVTRSGLMEVDRVTGEGSLKLSVKILKSPDPNLTREDSELRKKTVCDVPSQPAPVVALRAATATPGASVQTPVSASPSNLPVSTAPSSSAALVLPSNRPASASTSNLTNPPRLPVSASPSILPVSAAPSNSAALVLSSNRPASASTSNLTNLPCPPVSASPSNRVVAVSASSPSNPLVSTSNLRARSLMDDIRRTALSTHTQRRHEDDQEALMRMIIQRRRVQRRYDHQRSRERSQPPTTNHSKKNP